MKAPSVIIGVGGIGAEICARVEQMLPENAPGRDAFRFVMLDTDVNTLRNLHRKGFQGRQIQLTENMTVGNCRKSLGEVLNEWYPESEIFEGKSMTEGAGQQRSISRLALEYAVQSGKLAELYAEIESLREIRKDKSIQKIRFYIISSLAGGTGSGIILPIAMYLKRFVKKMEADDLSVCKGFFLLPSGLDEDSLSQHEQRSMKTNAYAAVKELSAFMGSADGDRQRYCMEMPLAENLGDGVDRYKRSSYEYCFLFGKYNQEGKLGSFEDLKDMVAKSVYMQACSPIHDRNSSREDNVIKHLISRMQKQGGRSLQRFGSIGCGEVVYPYAILSEYMALNWAVDAMEYQWQKYDQSYFSKYMEQKERKKSGKKSIEINRSDEYKSAVKNAGKQDLLAELIRNSCIWENGSYSWKEYLDVMWAEVDSATKKNWESLIRGGGLGEKIRASNMALELPGSKKKKEEDYQYILNNFGKLKDEVQKGAEECGTSIGREWFELHELIEEQPEYYLEYWFAKEEEFIHPNAVRYFLYNLEDDIKERKKQEEDIRDNAKSAFENIKPRKGGEKGISRLWHNYGKENEKIQKALVELSKYASRIAFIKILEQCEEYIHRLILGYERFYDSYEELKDYFMHEIVAIETRLDNESGISTFYVCADGECREKWKETLRNSRCYDIVGSDLSYQIYEIVHKNFQIIEDRRRMFKSLKDYWVRHLKREFPELNLNILQAKEKEEEFKYGKGMSDTEYTEWINKCKMTVSAPFIKIGVATQELSRISICCYNSELDESLESTQRKVMKWIREHDGIDDPYYCDRYRLIFYGSFVGLRADDVWEFVHGLRGEIEDESGEAFKAYEQTLKNMGRASDEMVQITPHMDKRWHSFLEMPDPDAEYQMRQEHDIAKAFWTVLLLQRLEPGQNEYTIAIYETDAESEKRAKRFQNFASIHEFLYENSWWTHQLLEQLNNKLENKEGRKKIIEHLKMDTFKPFICLKEYEEKQTDEQKRKYHGEIQMAYREQYLIEALGWIMHEAIGTAEEQSLMDKWLIQIKDAKELHLIDELEKYYAKYYVK